LCPLLDQDSGARLPVNTCALVRIPIAPVLALASLAGLAASPVCRCCTGSIRNQLWGSRQDKGTATLGNLRNAGITIPL